jgi:nucleoside-diphosphate-sugar epimerase
MILITGASGFIGEELIRSMNEKVRVISRKNLKLGKNAEIFTGNLTDREFVSKAMKGIDRVIHLASIINPNDKNIFKVNVDATKYLVDEALKSNIKKFVYLSSDNVFLNIQDNYAKTKVEAEKIVGSLSNNVILRPTVVYGKGDERYLGKIIKMSDKLPIIPIIGAGKFQPIYVEDLVKCIVESVNNEEIRGKYVVAGPTIISFRDFVSKINEIRGMKKIHIIVPSFFLKPFIFLYGILSKEPLITISQIKNMDKTRIYDTEQNKITFDYIPTKLDDGLRKSIAS